LDADAMAEGGVPETPGMSQAATLNITATATNRIDMAPTIR
jgi:hypothetical protein